MILFDSLIKSLQKNHSILNLIQSRNSDYLLRKTAQDMVGEPRIKNNFIGGPFPGYQKRL
jgi:hypothetical protein